MADVDIDRHDLLLTLGLAFVGGYGDAAGLLLAKTFTGHVTGNLVFVALSVVSRNWSASLQNFSAIAAFLLGVVLSVVVARSLRITWLAYFLPLVMTVEVVLIAGAALALGTSFAQRTEIFVVGTALALGLQNGAFQRAGGVSVHTTYLTGTITRLITAEVGKLDARQRIPPAAAGNPGVGILGGIWLAFVLGAGAGAAMIHLFQGFGLLGAAAILLALVVRILITDSESRVPD